MLCWLVWLTGLGIVMQTKRLPVQFLVRAHAWNVSQDPGWWCARGNRLMFLTHIDVSFPLFLFLPPVSERINKIFQKIAPCSCFPLIFCEVSSKNPSSVMIPTQVGKNLSYLSKNRAHWLCVRQQRGQQGFWVQPLPGHLLLWHRRHSQISRSFLGGRVFTIGSSTPFW